MLLEQIVPALRLSIGPVILISGAGLVLLSMTNRYARVIDRARNLAESLRQKPTEKNERIQSQIKIIAQRARKSSSGHSMYILQSAAGCNAGDSPVPGYAP